MEVKIVDIFTKKEVSTKKIVESLYGKEVRLDIIKRVILWQLNKRRSGNHKVKTISEIRGTTAKPFRQKGTGNARAGSKRSAHHRGGQTTFGPVVRSHATALPKKVRALGLKSAILHHLKNKSVILVQDPKLTKASTKKAADAFKDDKEKTLFIYSEKTDQKFVDSVRNIKDLNNLKAQGANVYDIMNHKKLYVTDSAWEAIQERFAK